MNSRFDALNHIQEVISVIDMEKLVVVWANECCVKKFGPIKENTTCFEYFYNKNDNNKETVKEELMSNISDTRDRCISGDLESIILGSGYKTKKSFVEIDGKTYLLCTLYDIDSFIDDYSENAEAKDVYETLISKTAKINLKGEFKDQILLVLQATQQMFCSKRTTLLKIVDGVVTIVESIALEDAGEFTYNPIMKNIIKTDPELQAAMSNNRYIELNLDTLYEKYPKEFQALKDEGDYNFSLMTWSINHETYFLVIENYSKTIKNKYAYHIIYNFLFFTIRSLIYNKVLYRLGNIDFLTGLETRNKFNSDVADMADETLSNVGLLFLDLDRLKEINDNFSHKTGDKLIKAMAKVLSEVFEGQSVYRMGGDEFLVLTRGIDYNDFHERIVRMKKRMDAGHIFASYGMCYEQNNGIILQMLETAEHEMYVYKRIHHQYSLEEEQNAFIELFKATLKRNGYFIVIQPKFNPYTNELTGGEVLVRGREKDGSIDYPNSFIPLFEKNHCIDILDYFVMEEVCKLQRRILDTYGKTVPISFNVSRTTLLLESFVNDLTNMVEKYNLEKWMIRMEITERMDVNAEDVLLYGLRAKEAGFGVEVDDFGSHFTNLNFFKINVFSTIKIDRHIINKLSVASVTSRIISVIIEECHKHGIQIVAEGIETEVDLEVARKMNVDYVQGYYFDRPMFIEDFLAKYFEK